MTDYKHTWELDANSRLLRFYAWAWSADPKKADFCRLFWGTLFGPLAVLARIFTKPVLWLTKKYDAKHPPHENKTVSPPSGDRLDGIVTFMSRPGVRKVLGIVGKTLMVLYGLALVALLVYAFVSSPIKFLIAIGVVLVGALIVFGGMIVADRHESNLIKAGHTIVAAFREVKRNTCPRVEVKNG